MKPTNYFLLFVIALAIVATSCKKDKAKSGKEILTSVSWKMTSSKVNGVVQAIEDCAKDDFLTFTVDGNYTYNVGALTCYEGEATYGGTWTLSADEKTLTVDGDAAAVVITENQISVTITGGSDTTVMIFVPK
jgi:hypothetical protein